MRPLERLQQGSLAVRFPHEGATTARTWLSRSADTKKNPELLALAVMREEERNDCIDVPELLKHAHAALAALQKVPAQTR